MWRLVAVVVAVATWVGCNCGGSTLPDGGTAGGTAGGEGGGATGGANAGGSTGGGSVMDRTWSFRFTTDGGTFVAGRFTLTIPAGALDGSVDVTVRESLTTTVPGATLTGPVYFFEPAGLEFTDAVEVRVQTDDMELGMVRWSGESGGPDESIGWVVNGVGEGVTRHFSRAYTAKGACIDPKGPGRNRCECAATDCQGGLLDKQPQTGTRCGNYPTETKWSGTEGAPCSGWARRTLEVWQCSCRTTQSANLCPIRWTGTALQSTCNAPRGISGFDGGPIVECDGGPPAEGRACSGFLQTPLNQAASGTLQGCGAASVNTTWQEINGVLASCSDLNPPLPPNTMLCPPGTPQRDRISQACHEALSQHTGGAACPQAGSNSGVVGTKLGQQIEGQYAKDPDQLTQLAVPGASKSNKCKSGNDGFPDLVKVTNRTASSITVLIGDVKPLTPSGLAKGSDDIYSCYQRDFAKAADKCKPGATRTPADTAFCTKLGALDKMVNVDTDGNLGFSSGQFCGDSVDGGPVKVEAIECQPGVTAYRCVP